MATQPTRRETTDKRNRQKMPRWLEPIGSCLTWSRSSRLSAKDSEHSSESFTTQRYHFTIFYSYVSNSELAHFSETEGTDTCVDSKNWSDIKNTGTFFSAKLNQHWSKNCQEDELHWTKPKNKCNDLHRLLESEMTKLFRSCEIVADSHALQLARYTESIIVLSSPSRRGKISQRNCLT